MRVDGEHLEILWGGHNITEWKHYKYGGGGIILQSGNIRNIVGGHNITEWEH